MMKALFACIILLACAVAPVQADKAFNSVVIFGDSLSDNGNLYRYLWGYVPLSPPYYQGRFSNGPVWTEQLFAQLYGDKNKEGFQDYAVGGAGAVLSYKENLPYTLTVELDNYLYWNRFDHPENSLFTIWIGANNYLKGPENVDSLTTGVVNAIGEVTERLIARGGNKFLIGNLPDLGLIPEARMQDNAALLSLLSRVHNEKLAEKTACLQAKYPDVMIVYLDVHALFQNALDDPEKYGLRNTDTPCYPGSYTGWLQAVQITPDMIYSRIRKVGGQMSRETMDMIADNPALLDAARVAYTYQGLSASEQEKTPNCAGYMFWDHVHPSTEIHRLIAEYALRHLNQAGLHAVLPPDTVVENPYGRSTFPKQNATETTGRFTAEAGHQNQ